MERVEMFYCNRVDGKKDGRHRTLGKMEAEILNKIMRCGDKHELALVCGGEYIWQNDEAQVDAIQLVCEIFDIISAEGER